MGKRIFLDDLAVDFKFDDGVDQLLLDTDSQEIDKWYDYCHVIISPPNSAQRETVPDMFLFNYQFFRPFTQEDYNQLKEKHKNIIIGLFFDSNVQQYFWNYPSEKSVGDPRTVLEITPTIKNELHEYTKSILGTIPDFLWDTDCLFLIIENHEFVDNLLVYYILWIIHDLEEKRRVNPKRFYISDCSTPYETDSRAYMFYKTHKFKNKVNFKGFNRFEALTSLYYSGYYDEPDDGRELTPLRMNYDLTKKRNKKFLFLNRIKRDHRSALILTIHKNGLLFKKDNFHFSYTYTRRDKDNDTYCRKAGVISYIKEFETHVPIILDTSNLKAGRKYSSTGIADRIGKTVNIPEYFGLTGDTRVILKFVKDSYFNLISETDASPNYLFLTEKTFKCMAWKQPFIIWGNPNSLRRLRKLGYKTFHPWVDESYDDITDSNLRLKAIYEEVKKICEMNLNEVHDLYQELIPIIEYNYDHFNYQKIIRRNYDYTIREFLPPTPVA